MNGPFVGGEQTYQVTDSYKTTTDLHVVAPAASDRIRVESRTEQTRVLGDGGAEIELRRLTPEEKARRRFRRNLILFGVCLAILMVVVYVMTR